MTHEQTKNQLYTEMINDTYSKIFNKVLSGNLFGNQVDPTLVKELVVAAYFMGKSEAFKDMKLPWELL